MRPIATRDLAPPTFEHVLQTASLTLARTDPGHLGVGNSSGDRSQFAEDKKLHHEIRPRGNAVSREDEMLKLAGTRWNTTR
jgi:flagellar basal body rod protein FlgB